MIQMLKLAGWDDVPSDIAPITVTNNNGRSVDLYSFPSLVRPQHYGFVMEKSRFAFSPYELSRDLPGAFGIISS